MILFELGQYGFRIAQRIGHLGAIVQDVGELVAITVLGIVAEVANAVAVRIYLVGAFDWKGVGFQAQARVIASVAICRHRSLGIKSGSLIPGTIRKGMSPTQNWVSRRLTLEERGTERVESAII